MSSGTVIRPSRARKMKIIIDEELKGILTRDWIKKVLKVVDPDMLKNLTIRVIEPRKYDKEVDWNDWSNEETRKELARRIRGGTYPGGKTVEVFMRRRAWAYYLNRRSLVRMLYHEIYHANDPNLHEEWEPSGWEDPYWNHPAEVRARTFEKRMFRQLKNKRGIILMNVEVRAKHPDLFRDSYQSE